MHPIRSSFAAHALAGVLAASPGPVPTALASPPAAMTQEPAPRPVPSAPPSGQAEVTVEVTVDFGPLARPRLHGRVVVPNGSSVVAATRALPGLERAVEQDWLCCSAEDVWSIAGVGPEPRLDRAWSWRLGDRSGPELPARHRVADGDAIT